MLHDFFHLKYIVIPHLASIFLSMHVSICRTCNKLTNFQVDIFRNDIYQTENKMYFYGIQLSLQLR